jgi:hypothetical protein|tara:strand:- start:1748 stop:2266 length:519 start_codon:yes stop_codon:yes gene_type:complete
MSEENNSSVESQETQTPVGEQHQSDDNVDYKSLYMAEVQNSKKQRAAKQEYKSELEKIATNAKAREQEQLVEQQKFKELWEKDRNDAEWARNYKADRHSKLLDKLPEDKREKFTNLDLTSLEAVVDEFVSVPKEPSRELRGRVSTPKIDKSYDEMTDNERRQWHEDVMKQYK